MNTDSIRPRQFAILVSLLAALLGSGAAQAQLQFSSWPVCDNGLYFPAGRHWEVCEYGVERCGAATQPVPAKASDWELSSIAVAASFYDNDTWGDLDDLFVHVTSAEIMAWLGPRPQPEGAPAGTPFFSMSVSLSEPMFSDTGIIGHPDLTIWRVQMQIPVQVIPAGQELQLGVALVLDPTIGTAGIYESVLIGDPGNHGWVYSFEDGTNFSDGFGGGCGDMIAMELYGPTAIPAVSEWGIVVMGLLTLTAGTLVYARRYPTKHAA